jgi:integrase
LVVLPEDTADKLSAWLFVRGDEPGPLFWSGRARHLIPGQRLTGHGVWRVLRRLGKQAGVGTVRPHGIKHTATTVAIERARAAGYGLEDVLDLTRHADVTTLLIYQDRASNVQGQLSDLLAASASSPSDGSDGG